MIPGKHHKERPSSYTSDEAVRPGCLRSRSLLGSDRAHAAVVDALSLQKILEGVTGAMLLVLMMSGEENGSCAYRSRLRAKQQLPMDVLRLVITALPGHERDTKKVRQRCEDRRNGECSSSRGNHHRTGGTKMRVAGIKNVEDNVRGAPAAPGIDA